MSFISDKFMPGLNPVNMNCHRFMPWIPQAPKFGFELTSAWFPRWDFTPNFNQELPNRYNLDFVPPNFIYQQVSSINLRSSVYNNINISPPSLNEVSILSPPVIGINEDIFVSGRPTLNNTLLNIGVNTSSPRIVKKDPPAPNLNPKFTPSTVNNSDELFNSMLKFVLKAEGGYNPDDCGQAGNYGIQQNSYTAYRYKRGLPFKDVRLITETEVRDLYYNDYYKASGADKISDPKLALYVFDTAVNMGVSAAKDLLAKSGHDLAKFVELRKNRYHQIANNNDDKRQYLAGWINRMDNLNNYIEDGFLA